MSALQEFFSMGGYGSYVWSAYAVTFVVLVFNIVIARRDYRLRLRNARRQQARRAERDGARAADADNSMEQLAEK